MNEDNKRPLAVVITDTHYGRDNIKIVDRVLHQAVELCVENGRCDLIHCGDVFTTRTGQTLEVLAAFSDFVMFCEKHGVVLRAIPGNHDKTDLNSERSYLDIFRNQSEHFVVHSDETCFRMGDLIVGFLPYFSESSGEYSKRLSSLCEKVKTKYKKDNSKKILFTHIAVNGVKNNGGSVVNDGVPTGNFSFWDKVIVGHYHNASHFKNVHYIGSSLPHNFGEDSEKGIKILYSNGDLESVKTDFPQYLSVKIDLDKVEWKGVEKLKQKWSQRTGTDFVRFVFIGAEEKLAQVNSSEFQEVGIAVKKEPVQILRSMEFASVNTINKFTLEDLETEFIEYCRLNDIDDLSFGLNVLKNVEFV